jgi:TPR repeat protein
MGAEQGHAFAQYRLSMMLLDGIGVSQDISSAVVWLQRAAEQGLPKAESQMGAIHEHGIGVSQDYVESVSWYKKAADQGDEDGLFGLGTCYEYGLGVDQDYSRAAVLYSEAADRGSVSAELNIGILYEKGLGVNRDRGRALEHFRRAAQQGHSRAKLYLGSIVLSDKSAGEADKREAFKYAEEAASEKLEDAMFLIGSCFEIGNGVEKNINKSMEWFEKAACEGHAVAQFRLATLLASEGSLRLSYFWFKVCNKNLEESGSHEAAVQVKDSVAQICSQMSMEEIREADRFFAQWEKSVRG